MGLVKGYLFHPKSHRLEEFFGICLTMTLYSNYFSFENRDSTQFEFVFVVVLPLKLDYITLGPLDKGWTMGKGSVDNISEWDFDGSLGNDMSKGHIIS